METFTMKSILILLIILQFLLPDTIAQPTQRYKNEVFSQIDSVKNAQFGEAKNIRGEQEKLLLDVYMPHGDSLTKRPLVVFVHGGGFTSGDKASGYPLLFSKGLAKRGYVCSSINYRLGIENPKNDTAYFEASYRAVQDAKAAVRYFRKNFAQFDIDTTQIYIMGGSAGAMTALQLAYLDQHEVPTYINTAKWGTVEGQSGNEGYSSRVKGVINCWGAMVNFRWIQKNDIPNFNIHGLTDNLVPSDSVFGYHSFRYGSQVIFEHSLALGIPTGIRLFENTAHTLDNDKTKQEQALQEAAYWLATQLAYRPTIQRFEKEIAVFEQANQTEKYTNNAILFTGSSFIRLWKNIKQDLAPHEIIHRGFGGSTVAEMAYYIPRIAFPYAPKAIVFYTGSNDIADSSQDKTPLQVLETFKYVVKTVRTKFPTIPIYWIAISPNERRWKVQNKIIEANELLKNYCQNTPNMHYIETMPQLLGKDGKYQADLYISDKLHFNDKGYAIWKEVIGGVLDKDFGKN